MKQEKSDQKSNNFNDINDDQERVFLQLSSIWDKKPIVSQKILTHLHELKLLQTILSLLISSGIIVLLILILMGFPLIIILIDIGIIISYVSYLVYLQKKFRKTFKITKRELRYFIEMKKKEKDISTLQLFFYSIVILITIVLLVFSMIGIDPLILILIIAVSLVYIYFDDGFKK